jgi:hypothetical protein
MTKKPKLGKISIVVFLTILIWVWADLAQDETLSLSNLLTISVARSSDPTLWISFEGPDQTLQASVTLDNVDLKGPASRVAEVERTKNKGDLEPDLFLVPEQEGMVDPGTRTFDVLNFLKQSDEITKLGLTVEGCEPRTVTIQVRRLEKRLLPVECIDLDGVILRGASIVPQQIEAYAPQDVASVAKVQLTAAELSQARVASIQKNPYVELAPGQEREISTFRAGRSDEVSGPEYARLLLQSDPAGQVPSGVGPPERNRSAVGLRQGHAGSARCVPASAVSYSPVHPRR